MKKKKLEKQNSSEKITIKTKHGEKQWKKFPSNSNFKKHFGNKTPRKKKLTKKTLGKKTQKKQKPLKKQEGKTFFVRKAPLKKKKI